MKQSDGSVMNDRPKQELHKEGQVLRVKSLTPNLKLGDRN